jgi:ribonuclease HI
MLRPYTTDAITKSGRTSKPYWRCRLSLKVVIYTDGACSGNPGPGGFAAILTAADDTGQVTHESVVTGGEPQTTNNRMEMRAVIEGLKALTRPSTVQVVSDSQYVIRTMTEDWKRNKNRDLWEEIDQLCQVHQVTWVYTKGHAGHEYNERCDQLAVAACQQFRDPTT